MEAPRNTITIAPINSNHRFRLIRAGCSTHVWCLEKKRGRAWNFVANDRSIVRLGLYCERRNILPDPENERVLRALAVGFDAASTIDLQESASEAVKIPPPAKGGAERRSGTNNLKEPPDAPNSPAEPGWESRL